MLLGILLTLLILVSVALTAVILLQRSEGGALGMGGGGGSLISTRGAADLLTRTTTVLGVAFFVLSLGITVLAGREHGAGSVTDQVEMRKLSPEALKAQRQQPEAPPAGPAAPAVQLNDAPLGAPALGSPSSLTQPLTAPPAAPAP